MDKIPLSDFIAGYEQGTISDVVTVKNKIYGKTPISKDPQACYRIVWSDIP